jgi:acyl carrier protein
LLYSFALTQSATPENDAHADAHFLLEALPNGRRSLGLPATCIAWGPIADSGYLARNESVLAALVGRMGGQALKSDDVLQALDAVLRSPAGNLAYLDVDWATLGRSLPASRAPKFSDLARLAGGAERGAHAESSQDLRRRLGTLGGAELLTELTAIVRAEVAEILRIAPDRIEAGMSLLDMGMDSLMAVELATSIEARLDVRLSALALSGGPTIENIVERVSRMLQPGEAAAEVAPSDMPLAVQVYMMSTQHADELTAENAADVAEEVQAGGSSLSLTRAARA